MSDLTFDQLVALYPQENALENRLTPRPRRLLPSFIVGLTVLLMPAGVVGAWEASQAQIIGEPIEHTLGTYEGLEDAAAQECLTRFSVGTVDVHLSAELSTVWRNGQELAMPYERIQAGDEVEVRCGTYALGALNERMPLQELVPYVIPLPEG